MSTNNLLDTDNKKVVKLLLATAFVLLEKKNL